MRTREELDRLKEQAVILRRHNPLATRKNTGDGYHGCLRADVKRSCELYRKIEGWAAAIMGGIRPENG